MNTSSTQWCNDMIEIRGKNVALRTMTLKEMRALWRKFEPENDMPYVYNEEVIDKMYEQSVEREEWYPTVGIFSKTDEIIGGLSFVRIVFSEKRCELSLSLASEGYRNKGYGTEAVMLAKKYAKESGRKPIIATMATESRLRYSKWLKFGCNAFDQKQPTSQPMSCNGFNWSFLTDPARAVFKL